MTRGIFAAASIGAFLIAAPALAGEDEQTQNTNVMYEDLDLSTDQGRAELDQRITIAARRTCGLGRHSTGTRSVSREQRRCVASAVRQARTALAPVIESQRLGG